MTVQTARVPELVAHTALLTDEDQIPVWIAGTNKTRKVAAKAIRDFLDPSINSGTYIPVQIGARILYVVPPEENGKDRFSIPGLAGKNFSVVLDMLPLIPGQDYLALNTGGIVLLNGAKLIDGQKFSIEVFELTDGSTPGGNSSSGSGRFINGSKLINTNWPVLATDSGIIHQLRKSTAMLEITMPDVSLVPVDSYFIFESFVGNNKQHHITFTGGQLCYFNNTSWTAVYIGQGEKFVFYRDVDGWYLIDGYQHYQGIGQPQFVYKQEFNHVVYDGREYNRADVPRLVQIAQTFGASWVDENIWQTASVIVAGREVLKPFRGCFSKGSDTVNFSKIRVPDWRDVAPVGLVNFAGTSDTQRYQNTPGVFQLNELISHTHDILAEYNGSDGNQNARTIKPNLNGEPAPTAADTKTQSYGGLKTRMDNIGVLVTAKF